MQNWWNWTFLPFSLTDEYYKTINIKWTKVEQKEMGSAWNL